MQIIDKFFGRAADPLTERADTLVQMANVAAISAFMPLFDRFPVLGETARDGNTRHFDFIVTIAAVFIAATRLRNLRLGETRERNLMDRVSKRLTEWDPQHGITAFEHCKAFFDRTYDVFKDNPKFATCDTIGAWMAWDVLNRCPETEEERSLARAMGVMVVHEFFNWWRV